VRGDGSLGLIRDHVFDDDLGDEKHVLEDGEEPDAVDERHVGLVEVHGMRREADEPGVGEYGERGEHADHDLRRRGRVRLRSGERSCQEGF